MNKIRILGIDTSCDDTSIAVLEVDNPDFKKPFYLSQEKIKLLSNIVSSQIDLDRKWGGVYPSLAQREHQKNLIPVLKIALKKSGLLKSKKEKLSPQKTDIVNKILNREPQLLKALNKFLKNYQKPSVDAIAVTIGPGLDPCLWVGINAAKTFSKIWKIPLIPINHLEAHILSIWLEYKMRPQEIFPAICLVVSGGHTQLVLVKNFHEYQLIGQTRDDAAGECFDKTARILGLPYPGGPAIAKQAKNWTRKNFIKNPPIKLPFPMLYSQNYDFSFSGLKTAVLYDFKKRKPNIRKSRNYIQEMSYKIQESIIKVLTTKTIKAALEYRVKNIIIGGGVSANTQLKEKFKQIIKERQLNINFLAPSQVLSTDNAAMVALAGYVSWSQNKAPEKIKSKPNLNI